MTYDPTDINLAGYIARDVSEHAAVAYWAKGDDKEYHVGRMISRFDNAAKRIDALRPDPTPDIVEAYRAARRPA